MRGRHFSRIPDLIGSRSLSFVLVGVLATWYVLLLIFSMKVHAEGVINISRTLPFKVLYGLLFANLLACTLRRTPSFFRRCGRKAAVGDGAEPAARIGLAGTVQGLEPVERLLRKRRYAVTKEAGVLNAVNGRFSVLGSLLSHWGMVILLLGVVISLNTRFTGEAHVAEGDRFWGTAREYMSYDPPTSFRQWAPKVSFRVEKVEAEFWEDKLLFTRLAAYVRSPVDSKEKPVEVRINEPLFSDFYSTSLRVTGYGFAPLYVLRNERGKELESSYVSLAIFPPGSEDSFKLNMIPHRFYVKLYPDYRQKQGRPSSASMNLKNPVFHLKAAGHKIVTYDGLLLPYQRADVEGYSIAFEQMKRWVTIQVVRDRGYPVIFVGACLICLGSLWRFGLPRRDVVVRMSDDGTEMLVYCRADSLLPSEDWAGETVKGLEQELKKVRGEE